MKLCTEPTTEQETEKGTGSDDRKEINTILIAGKIQKSKYLPLVMIIILYNIRKE